jgi:nucleoside permease NupC
MLKLGKLKSNSFCAIYNLFLKQIHPVFSIYSKYKFEYSRVLRYVVMYTEFLMMSTVVLVYYKLIEREEHPFVKVLIDVLLTFALIVLIIPYTKLAEWLFTSKSYNYQKKKSNGYYS